jgi:hypothetical protein
MSLPVVRASLIQVCEHATVDILSIFGPDKLPFPPSFGLAHQYQDISLAAGQLDCLTATKLKP